MSSGASRVNWRVRRVSPHINFPSHLPIVLPSYHHNMDSNKIYDLVQASYGDLASRSSAKGPSKVEENVARAFGYEASELSSIPSDANLGVSCGNPTALANLREVSLREACIPPSF